MRLKRLKKPKISVLIPAHNEEKSIRKCIISALEQTRPPDEIIVINDGSTDLTSKIIDEFSFPVIVVEISQATGNKSFAQETGMIFVNGDIVIMTDADTIFDKKFIENVLPKFADKEVVAVSGYVKSMKHNWLTACREIEYAIGQQIHKLAQTYLGYFMVIPGCAAAFRTEAFNKFISFDHDTVAEDLDFTYKLNEQGFKIKYSKGALVYTQDPADLKSYINQMKRWYGGNWQNLFKHMKVLSKPIFAFEFSLLFIESVLFPLVIFCLLLINIFYLLKALAVVLFMASVVSGFASIVDKRNLIKYTFHYFFIIFVNSIIFLWEFFKEIILKKRELNWFQPKRREIYDAQ